MTSPRKTSPAKLAAAPVPPTLATKDMLIGALLRVPAEAIHRRIIRELNDAGFNDLSLPHIVVFRFPGPDGVRPGVLAQRAATSKQAMNRLLGSLEDLGYLKRSSAPREGRARIVRLTRRGHAVYARIVRILQQIEREWIAELGATDFARLKQLLIRIWASALVR